MHYIINIDFNFSIFGLLFFGMLFWGAYRGYRLGGIITGLSLFALVVGFVVSAGLTMFTYKYFVNKSQVPEVFGASILGISFLGAIWFMHFVQNAVFNRLRDVNPDKTNNFVGAGLGIVKYFIIFAVYATVILNLDCKGHLLPERDRKSHSLNISKNILTKSVKMLRMDYHMIVPCYPEDILDQYQPTNNDDNTNTDNNGFDFPTENDDNSYNSQPNNNNNNQSNTTNNPIVEDVNP